MRNAIHRFVHAHPVFVASLCGGLFSVFIDLDYFLPGGQVEPVSTLALGLVFMLVGSHWYRSGRVVLK
jgi:hypothetical protein